MELLFYIYTGLIMLSIAVSFICFKTQFEATAEPILTAESNWKYPFLLLMIVCLPIVYVAILLFYIYEEIEDEDE